MHTDLYNLILFEMENVEDFLVCTSLEKAAKERKILYSVTKFNLPLIPSENCQFMFRFEKHDIIQLYQVLQLPDGIETSDQHIIDGIGGLCLLPRRLVYPNRLKELQEEFGLHYTSLSKLLHEMIDLIYKKWGTHPLNLSENNWFTLNYQKELATMVYEKGAPLTNCIGFLDGTVRAICRPTVNQKEMYSGHKRQNCVVQYLQFRYQRGVLYRLKALGERHNMDITIEGFHSWMWRGLSFLLPFLFAGYVFQLYNAYVLYQLSYYPSSTWHVIVLSIMFFILFTGNVTTTVMVIPDKLKERVKLQYRLMSQSILKKRKFLEKEDGPKKE